MLRQSEAWGGAMKRGDRCDGAGDAGFAAAMDHHRAGRLAEAETLYARVLAAEPGNARAHALRGLARHQAGDGEGAVAHLARAVALDPGDLEATFHLANLLSERGRQAEALPHFERVVAARPEFAPALTNLGQALTDLGRHSEAVPWFERALAREPGLANALNGLGLALQAGGRLDEAIGRYRAALDQDPRFAEAHNNLGTVLAARGDHAAAADAFRRALALAPGFTPARLNLAGALAALGRAEQAIAEYGRVIAAAPRSAELRAGLGALLRDLGRPDEALAAYRAAVALAPEDPRARLDLGVALQEVGRIEPAIAEYRKVAEHTPASAEAHHNLALAFLALGRHDEAEHAFRDVVRIEHGGAWWNARDFADTLARVGAPRRALRASTFRLADAADQVDYLIGRGALTEDFAEMARRYRCACDAMAAAGGAEASGPVPAAAAASIAPFFGRVVHFADAPRGREPTVNPALDAAAIEASYLASPIAITTIDDLLSPWAFACLRRFCLENTIYFSHSEARFVGSDLPRGFNCGLLYQIAEELKARLPCILGTHPLTNCWVYRHRAETVGVEAHTDQGAVTLNFWLTPDEANLEPGRGGLEVYAREQPYDWDWKTYNRYKYTPRVLAEIEAFLADTETLTVAYRANRALLFNSNLFHKSDRVRFADAFETRRINVTMLFGKRRAG